MSGVQLFADVAIKDVEPYRETVILSDYRRDVRLFRPEWMKVSFGWQKDGEAYWRTAEAHGYAEGARPGKLIRRVQVRFGEDEETGSVEHWPAYALLALAEARKMLAS